MASQRGWRYPVRISLLPPPPPPSEEVRTHGDSDLSPPPQTDYENIETYAYHDLQTSPVLLEDEVEEKIPPPRPPQEIIVCYHQDAKKKVTTLKEKKVIPKLSPPLIPAMLTSGSSEYPIPPPPIMPTTGPVSGVFPVTSRKPNAEINLAKHITPDAQSIPPPPPPPPEEIQSSNTQETSNKKKKPISATVGRVKSSKNKDKSQDVHPTKVDKHSTAAYNRAPKEIPKIKISYKVGDKLEVQKEDGTWMKGKVTLVEDQKVVVTFVMDGKKYQSEMFLS